MSSMLLVYIIFVFFGFIAMAAIFTPIANKYAQNLKMNLSTIPFIYMFSLYAMGTIGAYFLNNAVDFVEPLTPLRVFLPLILTGIIFAVSLVETNLFFSCIVIACVTVNVLLQPFNIGFPFPDMPHWLAQILLIAFFSVFCLYYKVLNILPQTVVIPTIFMLLGISMLSGLSAAPVFIALSGAMLLGSLAGYLGINLYNIKVGLDDGTCTALAFIISSLFLLNVGEFSFMSCVIFSGVFWVELLSAIWHRYFSKSGELSENTNYARAAHIKSMYDLMLSITKICSISLFLGWFQLFSVNQYSLFIVAMLIILWLNGLLAKDAPQAMSLKELNKEFVASIKQNINEAKENISIIRNKEDR